MWQKGGSGNPVVFEEAVLYVDSLNAGRHGGFADWRLPTLEEAMTLLAPAAPGTLHIDAAFQRGVNFIWTADQLPNGHGFVIYFHDGLAAAESKQFNAYVRAVRGMT